LYIASAQAVVVPSLSEGFGFSVAESCATGTPVVASRVGSIPEVISGQFVLIEPASAAAIAQGVLQVKHGQLNHTPLKQFSWDAAVEAHEQLYKNLLPTSSA
jgi:glycosyltransferase involved in cell wall biosynthesis